MDREPIDGTAADEDSTTPSAYYLQIMVCTEGLLSMVSSTFPRKVMATVCLPYFRRTQLPLWSKLPCTSVVSKFARRCQQVSLRVPNCIIRGFRRTTDRGCTHVSLCWRFDAQKPRVHRVSAPFGRVRRLKCERVLTDVGRRIELNLSLSFTMR